VKIDSHQHFLFPSQVEYPWLEGEALDPLRRDFGPADLQHELEQNGIQHTILVQTRPSLSETQEFLELAAQTSFVAGVVGWVDLTDSEVGSVLDALLNSVNGRFLVGIRHQVHDEPDPMWLLRADVQRGLEALTQRGLSYDLLVRARELPAAVQVARAHPKLTLVLDHLAKPEIRAGGLTTWNAALEPLESLPNVFVKLSGLVTEADWKTWTAEQIVPYLEAVLKRFGPDRCLYGSDWPVCLLAASYGQTLELVLEALADYGDLAQNAVLGGTATRAYRRLCSLG
jgi:L-fuconolactonase